MADGRSAEQETCVPELVLAHLECAVAAARGLGLEHWQGRLRKAKARARTLAGVTTKSLAVFTVPPPFASLVLVDALRQAAFGAQVWAETSFCESRLELFERQWLATQLERLAREADSAARKGLLHRQS